MAAKTKQRRTQVGTRRGGVGASVKTQGAKAVKAAKPVAKGDVRGGAKGEARLVGRGAGSRKGGAADRTVVQKLAGPKGEGREKADGQKIRAGEGREATMLSRTASTVERGKDEGGVKETVRVAPHRAVLGRVGERIASFKTANTDSRAAPIDLANSAAERLAGRVRDVVDVRGDVPVVERRSFASRVQRSLGGRWSWAKGWVDGVRAWWWSRPQKSRPGEVDPRQLDEVKASVMSELKNIRAGREMASTAPFDSPFAQLMLPPTKPVGRPRLTHHRSGWPRGWVVFGVMVVVLAGSLWWLSGLKPVGPDEAITHALAAVKSGDVVALEERVDVDSVAVSVVDQVLTNPQVDLAVLPGDLQAELQQSLKARMEALIKPGIAARMADQVREMVAAQRMPVEGQDGVLGQVWADLGGAGLDMVEAQTTVTDASNALVLVLLSHNGVAMEPAMEVMVAQQGGRWQVVGLPNLAAVIRARDAARQGNAPVEAAAPTVGVPVQVANVVKAKGPEGVILISADVVNVSGVAQADTKLAVQFADAAGTPLYATELTLPEPLAPGEARTQTWSVPLDMQDARAKYVYALPQGAMRTTVEVSSE